MFIYKIDEVIERIYDVFTALIVKAKQLSREIFNPCFAYKPTQQNYQV